MTGTFAPVRFAPRRAWSLGLRTERDWRVKTYAIVAHGALDSARFAPGWKLALAALPEPAATAERPGIALAIAHQGRTGDYLVLAWWDRENELPLRGFVRDGDRWRAARGSESICVWDLELLWREREAYVATVLGEGGPERYLETWACERTEGGP
jgi:hypothetical protein